MSLSRATRVARAVVLREFGGPEMLRTENVDIASPGAGQVLLRNSGCGVNPADTYIRTGVYGFLPELPWTPGLECAGYIEEVGEGVTEFSKGQPVSMCCVGDIGLDGHTGAYAEYCVADAKLVSPLPPNVDPVYAAGMPVAYQTAVRALVRSAGGIVPSDCLLVHGASGAVGLAVIQIARLMGVGRIIGTASSEEGRQAVLDQGADAVVNHNEEGYDELLMAATANADGGDGFSVIVEMLANENLARDLQLLRSDGTGRIAIVGNRGPTTVDFREAMTREAVISGVYLWSQRQEEREEVDQFIYQSLENGSLKPVVSDDGIFELEEAETAHHEVIAHERVKYGKIVLKI